MCSSIFWLASGGRYKRLLVIHRGVKNFATVREGKRRQVLTASGVTKSKSVL